MDKGASFEPQSGTLNSVIPPAVQHLTVEVSAADGQYLAQAKWDTPKVVKGVSFMLRLTVVADDGSERLVSTARTTETTIPLHATGAGELQADSPGGKCVGAAGRSGVGIVPDCRTGSAVTD
ncbi:putative host specificity protein [Escherichia coli]|uniref:Putative host specificity protein n=1 Tax=Escherichia coli TaxID=562 RepID=A0A377ECX1_ECOLX|nr:putative host specificity protein [Escherichia coli]